MKKFNKHKFAVLLAAVLLMAAAGQRNYADSGTTTTLPDAAPGIIEKTGAVAAKEEAVYASLLADGTTSSIYVVNILDVAIDGTISDYGRYAEVRNLTNLESISNQEGVTTVFASAGKFYYQGNISGTDLPWDINVRYTLDSQEISAAELAGKSGELAIELRTSQNKSANPVFYENYILQISITLDTSKCRNLTADGATLANSGKNKLVSFTVMPDMDGYLLVSADVTGFEMDGISISALPYAISFDLPDLSEITGQLTQLSDAISQLDTGIAGLDEGIRTLSSGAAQLQNGSSRYKSGIADLSAKSSDIRAASATIGKSLSDISVMLNAGIDLTDLAALSSLPAALDHFSAGVAEMSGGLTGLKSGFLTAFTALDNGISSIPAPISESDLQALYTANAGNATFDQLMAHYTAAQTAKATYTAVKPAFSAVGTTLGSMILSLDDVSASLDGLSGQLASSLASQDITGAITQLSSGISALSAGYSVFHQGLVAYTDGITRIASGYADLDAGLADLANGLGSLKNGMFELGNGSSELGEQTRDLPAKLDNEIDELLSSYDDSDFIPVSFVSAQNINITGVQFVLATAEIKRTAEPDPVPETASITVWSKLLDLFSQN